MQSPEYHVPQNTEAERAVIGCCLVDHRAAEIVSESLAVRDFADPPCRTAFVALAGLVAAGRRADDGPTAVDALERAWTVPGGGREFYHKLLLEDGYGPSRLEHYIAILKSKTIDRELYEFSVRLRSRLEAGESGAGLLSEAASDLAKVEEGSILTSDAGCLQDEAQAVANDVLSGYKREAWGITCGVADGALDRLTMGFKPSEFCLLAGLPSMGKSTLVNAIVRGVAQRHDGMPLYVSTEMSGQAIARSSLAAAAGISVQKLHQRDLTNAEKKRVDGVIQSGILKKIRWASMCGRGVNEVAALAKRHKREHGLSLVVVDMATGLSGSGKDEYHRASGIARGLRDMSRNLNVPVVPLVHMSRSVFAAAGFRPKLHNLRDTGEWEQVADRVLFIHRPKYHDKSEADNATEIIQAKDRECGITDSVFIEWNPKTGGYADASAGRGGV